MKTIIAAFLCIISINGYCQSKCDCFERLYQLSINDTNSNRGITTLKDAVSFLEPEKAADYYWILAQRFKKMKQYDSSIVWYEKAIESGHEVESIKRTENEIYRRMDTNKINKIILEQRKKINFDLYNMFVSQHAIDQAIRNEDLFPIDDASMRECIIHVLSSAYKTIDDSTFRFLKNVFENYGFPTFHKLGFFPAAINIMILHVTAYKNENATYVLQKLEEFNKYCDYNKFDILMLKDRQMYINEKKNTAGLFGSGERYLYIKDVGKVDSIRFEYNCVRLKDEADTWGGKLPDNYKPRPYPINYFCLEKYKWMTEE